MNDVMNNSIIKSGEEKERKKERKTDILPANPPEQEIKNEKTYPECVLRKE